MNTGNFSGFLSNYYKRPDYNKDTYNQTRVSAPTTSAAPTTVNYGGAKDYGQYAQKNTTGRYSNYLSREYADPTKLATNEKGETAYDMQRQQVTGDVEAERARQQEDLRRRLAASGMQDSGMGFKQQRMLAKDLGEYGGQQKSGIAIEEMGARERQATRLGEQAFESEESGKNRAESQRQFDSDQNLRVALQGNANAMRAWTEGNKQAFDTWVQENNINKDDADRYWDTEMNERDIISQITRDFIGIEGDITKMNLQESFAARRETRKTKTDYYFNAGKMGSINPDDLNALKEKDPDAYYAYMSGQEGKKIEDVEFDLDRKWRLYDALIVAATDPDTYVEVSNSIKAVADTYGYGSEPEVKDVVKTYEGGKDIPALGAKFVYNGTTYRRQDTPVKTSTDGTVSFFKAIGPDGDVINIQIGRPAAPAQENVTPSANTSVTSVQNTPPPSGTIKEYKGAGAEPPPVGEKFIYKGVELVRPLDDEVRTYKDGNGVLVTFFLGQDADGKNHVVKVKWE